MLPQEAIKRFDALYTSSMRDAKKRFDLDLGDIDNELIGQGAQAAGRRITLLLEATQKLLAAQAAAAWRDLQRVAEATHDGIFDGYPEQLKHVLIEGKIATLAKQLDHLLRTQADRSATGTIAGKFAQTYGELGRHYSAEVDRYVESTRRGGSTLTMPGRGAGSQEQRHPPYVAPERIAELAGASNARFDLGRLVQLCVELNHADQAKSFMSSVMLVRAIVEHVPPIFGLADFDQVTLQYDAAGASFKSKMHRLQHLSRKVADWHLHQPIRGSEILPTERDVDFRAPIDELLGEVARILRANRHA